MMDRICIRLIETRLRWTLNRFTKAETRSLEDQAIIIKSRVLIPSMYRRILIRGHGGFNFLRSERVISDTNCIFWPNSV